MRVVPVVMVLLLAGCTAPATLEEESRVPAQELTVSVSWAPQQPTTGVPVTFTAHVQASAGETLASAVWSLGGATRNGTQVDHVFQEPGRFLVRFEATTGTGLTASKEETIVVRAQDGAGEQDPGQDPGEEPNEDPGQDPNGEPNEGTSQDAGTDGGGPNGTGSVQDEVVVAVLDTGIRLDHQAFAPGQVVAWHDFGRSGDSGVPSTLWDPDTTPYDDNGHGTAVASLVAGTGRHTPSHAPGVRLAVAKISDAEGSASWADVDRALRWATDTVGADVVSLSFYTYTPDPAAPLGGHILLEALERTRSAGTLPVVLAGNGYGNAGLPTMSWMHPPATSRHALVVGGASEDSTPVAPFGSMDPEVTAQYFATVACPSSATCYQDGGGTSYSTPLVAGMAARLLEVAAAEGLERPNPDMLEDLLKGSAQDTTYPPTMEGHGFLDAAAVNRALEHLRAGTVPSFDPVNDAYVETIGDAERTAWGG